VVGEGVQVQAVDRWVLPAWLLRLDGGPLHDGGDSLGWQTFDGDDPLPDSSPASLYFARRRLPHGLVDAEQQIEPSGAQGVRPGRSTLARG